MKNLFIVLLMISVVISTVWFWMVYRGTKYYKSKFILPIVLEVIWIVATIINIIEKEKDMIIISIILLFIWLFEFIVFLLIIKLK